MAWLIFSATPSFLRVLTSFGSLDVFQQKLMAWGLHVAVAETVDFIECDVLMAVQLEHSHEVGIFFVASVEFEFAVA